jgi:heptaprenyl diphosphate synthase
VSQSSPATLAIPIVDPGLTARLNDRMAVVERKLVETVSVADPLAHDVARHLVDAGGKRIRPFLTLLTGELGDGTRPEVLQAAIAVELTHLASLYHDDVMDSAPMRRGTPSVHMVWGNSVAIIVGDVLFARASGVVAGLGPEAVRIQAETFERLCMGQLHETVGPQPGDDPVAHYLSVLADKTASLVATSARYGAMFSGAPAAFVDVVAAYGERVGVAFQLADDVLDLASTGAASGKTPGTDLRDHVPTMPVLLLRQKAAAGTASVEDRALLAALDGDLASDDALAAVIAVLREHPVVEQTRALAATWAHDAAAQLGPLPGGPVREALESFAVSLADRAS